MDEYITRNNAISAVCFGCNQQFSNEPCEHSECTIRQSIIALPTADVAPKIEVAREIFKEIRELVKPITKVIYHGEVIYESPISLNEIEKKYTEGKT